MMRFHLTSLSSCLVLVLLRTILGTEDNLKNVIEHVHPKTGARWYAGPVPRSLVNYPEGRLACSFRETAEERAKRETISMAHFLNNEELPKEFNATAHWPKCPSIGQIRDQSNCGSCWAFAAVGAMSDRYCIATGVNQPLSSVDLLSCCTNCGYGCHGGYPGMAWDYWKTHGLVLESCKSYPFAPCAHTYPEKHYKKCPPFLQDTPQCVEKCDSHWYSSYTKFYGNSSYNVPSNMEVIMREIMEHGPVEAGFNVYEDFKTYRSGVYFHSWGKSLGGHAVRLIGWGMDRDVPYWLVANSWNEEWGERGFFRILRGFNECEFEESIVAGLPRV